MKHFRIVVTSGAIRRSAITPLIAMLIFAAVTLTACDTGKEAEEGPVVLNTLDEKVSYALGMDQAANLQRMGAEVIPVLVARGLRDALEGENVALAEEEARRILTEYRQQLMQRHNQERSQQGAKNLEEGAKYLAENKTKSGVVTTDSGLQYKVLEEGSGPSPSANDRVKVHYRGTLLDGTEFDSSYKRGNPTTFNVSGLIAGWTEALQLMKVGSKWELVIPAELAYGERGSGPFIGPHATLVFQVELLEILE